MEAVKISRFNLLAGYVRDPRIFHMTEELEWYQSGNERFLGLVSRDKTDNDFYYLVLARDRLKRFRAVRWMQSFPSRKRARNALRIEFAKCLKQRTDNFYQGDEKGDSVDFFKPIVEPKRLNRAFRELSTRGIYPASKVLEEMLHWYEDVDGNFLEQFQTTAFDARLWELYLYATLIELGYAFDRSYQAPDFLCVGPLGNFCIEATTVNPSDPPVNLADMTKEEYYQNYVPMKFGSALYSKLQKRYWEKEHVKGMPLVFAIQDFHEFQSMSWSVYALSEYLFGAKNIKSEQNDGKIGLVTKQIEEYKIGKKRVPSGFFSQPGAENVSCVIANPGGTIAKFNRIGLLAGFGGENLTIIRNGFCFRESDEPEPFTYTVGSDGYSETWVEGLSVFHNPNAKHPLPPEYLPGAGHYYHKDGEIVGFLPPFHPIGSTSFVLHSNSEVKQDSKERDLIREKIGGKLDVKFRTEEQ